MALPTIKSSAFPYRRSSAASEDDFFDIQDEPMWAIAKRQFRHVRTWVILAAVLLFLIWWLRASPSASAHPHLYDDEVDWSRYAYSTYATSETYLCNAIMVFEALRRLGSRAERVLFYPKEWDLIVDDDSDRISQLLLMAKDDFQVQMVPSTIDGIKKETEGSSKASWDTSTAKLSAFGIVQYDRVIHLDSDILLLQHLDELFFLPPATVAMPRAYWLLPHSKTLSSLLAVIEPSYREHSVLMESIKAAQAGQVEVNLTNTQYDMEVLNNHYGDSAMVLPHRQYGLISGEFRTKNHWKFLGNDHEVWNPDTVLAEAKFVHFSDWPLPKPWTMWSQEQLAALQPACDKNPGTPEESGCRDREVWKELYDNFRRKRKDICKLLSYPAPI